MRREIQAVIAVCAAAGLMWWYFWPNERSLARLTAAPTSISYDERAMRLTAVISLQNSGARQTVASITQAMFIDSKKRALNGHGTPQPWRAELGPKQMTAVTFVLDGETAAAVWDGVQLMEVTMSVGYDAAANLNCNLSFMGRFYPQLKQIGTVSIVTSPRQC